IALARLISVYFKFWFWGETMSSTRPGVNSAPLSDLEKKVLSETASRFKTRYGSDSDSPRSIEDVYELLQLSDLDPLVLGLRQLAPTLKIRLVTAFGEVEEIITSSTTSRFGADEKKEAYKFLLIISDFTIPED